MDSGCLGNHVALRVPAKTGGGLARTESVCLGRLKRAVVYYMINRSYCVFGKCCKVHICLLYLSRVMYNAVLEQCRE